MEKNQVFTGEIIGCTSQGLGVARYEDHAVFVKGAIPGEICTIKLVKITKTVVYGRLEQVLTPSPQRMEPDCPYFGSCGGCDYRHMDYAMETEWKRRRVVEALRRIGGVDPEPLLITPATKVEGYRNKVQFAAAMMETGPDFGFYRSRTHDLIPITHCRIQFAEVDIIARTVRDWMRNYHILPYNERTGCVRHLFIRKADSTGQILVCLVSAVESLPKREELVEMLCNRVPSVSTIVYNVNTKPGNAILGETYHTLSGRGYIEDRMCGLSFRLSPASFYQVNHAQTEILYEKAIAMAELHGTEMVWDIYCGIGTITLALARYAGTVIGIESVPQAIADAQENARRNNIENVHFLCADAGEAMQDLADISPTVITVDPPRKGLAPSVISAIADRKPDRLVYVSCNPGTLARDVKLLGEAGYRLDRAEAVDLFPRTKHIETVVLLRHQNAQKFINAKCE